MKHTVYIMNDAGHDYSAAEEYGEIVFLTNSVVRKFDVQRLYHDISDKLRESEPEDYLVVGSLPILNALAASVQVRHHGKVNFLLFRGGSYVPKTVFVT